jgi:uncharacterized lipoprotein YmbA
MSAWQGSPMRAAGSPSACKSHKPLETLQLPASEQAPVSNVPSPSLSRDNVQKSVAPGQSASERHA